MAATIGTIGKYERLDVLGHGTSGVVYLAWDRLLRRQVALKEVRAAGPEVERVLAEAQVLDRLRHPHIVAVHAVDVDPATGVVLIEMELVRGKNLAEALREQSNNSPLPLAETLRITRAVLSALGFAHNQRVIHRDVKPANVLIGQNGAIKLTDFGLAEALGSHSVAGGGGTYPYMAPEDFAEHEASDKRADLWAVGVMLFEMLTGRRPFIVARSKDPFAWKRAIEQDEPTPLATLRPDLPPALGDVVARALTKNKNARFASADEFARALDAAVPHEEDEEKAPANAFAVQAPPAPNSGGAGSVAAVFTFADGTRPATLDELLLAAVVRWDEAREALFDGRLERGLRALGEVYIADMARELAQAHRAEPADADERLREFLFRSGLDLNAEARRRERLADDARRRGDAADADALLATARHLAPGRLLTSTNDGRTAKRLLRLPQRAARSEPPAPVAAPPPPSLLQDDATRTVAALPVAAPAPILQAEKKQREPTRWWFGPLLVLCLAPPAGALWSAPQGHAVRTENVLAAWSTTGILGALLLILGMGVRARLWSRVACFVLVAVGFVATGTLGRALFGGLPRPDVLVLFATGGAFLLLFLMAQAATARRLWRLWAFVVFALSLLAGVFFAANA